MNETEVIRLIKRNRNTKEEAITLLMDFLLLSKEQAEILYKKEIERGDII